MDCVPLMAAPSAALTVRVLTTAYPDQSLIIYASPSLWAAGNVTVMAPESVKTNTTLSIFA